jgi:hypothetical protein
MDTRTDVVILQTTWNRPRLIRQSLPQVEREAHDLGCPYVIADDQSDDVDTLALLAEAGTRDIEVIRREYVRKAEDQAHGLIGLNNLFGFEYVLKNYPSAKFILKCDDDIFVMPGAFRKMCRTWEIAAAAGYDIVMLAGLATRNEPSVVDLDGYSITEGACNAAVLYERNDWEMFLSEAKPGNVMLDGFDCHFMRFYIRKYRRQSVCVSIRPSMVYHTGFTGVHILGDDINKNFAGDIEQVVVR